MNGAGSSGKGGVLREVQASIRITTFVVVDWADKRQKTLYLAGRSFAGGEGIVKRKAFSQLSRAFPLIVNHDEAIAAASGQTFTTSENRP
jgi:hypothetical protein